MVAALLITLREGLEAALIVGIVLSILRRLGQVDRSRPVWWGVLVAVVASITTGIALNALGVAFDAVAGQGRRERIHHHDSQRLRRGRPARHGAVGPDHGVALLTTPGWQTKGQA